MINLKIIAYLCFALIVTYSQGKDLYSNVQAEKIVKKALNDKSITLKEKLTLNKYYDKAEPVSAWLFSKDSGNDFYVIITQAKGRYDMFDYLIKVNMDHEIEQVRIINYRSEYGGEIASKKWLQQFAGYSSGELKYKRDISAISGATISANSITSDIQNVMKIFKTNFINQR